jgi:hypothetical protein
MTIEFTYLGLCHETFRDLITSLPNEAVSKPTRSTVPLLKYWARPESRLADFLGGLGMPVSPNARLAFEYATPVSDGRGKSSFTDLMILMEGQSIAVEAKYTEPPYPSVKHWLGPNPSENRLAVLSGWLGSISEIVEKTISVEDVRELTYQLIHRTASACCAPGPLRVLVYQLFGRDSPAHYADELRALAKILGAKSPLQFWVNVCQYDPETLWPTWEKALPISERSAIIREKLLPDPGQFEAGAFERVA